MKQVIEDSEAAFLSLYEKRKTDHSEVCLIRDEAPKLFERFGVRPRRRTCWRWTTP